MGWQWALSMLCYSDESDNDDDDDCNDYDDDDGDHDGSCGADVL